MSKEQEIRELLCRHCDGISHADPCDIKDTCPVLRDAPGQIDVIYKQVGYRLPPEQTDKREAVTEYELRTRQSISQLLLLTARIRKKGVYIPMETYLRIQEYTTPPLSLFPELKVLETNPYYLRDIDGSYYNKYPEFQVYEDGKQAQLAKVLRMADGDLSKEIAYIIDYVEDKKCSKSCEHCTSISIPDSFDGHYYGQGDYSNHLTCGQLGGRMVKEGMSCHFVKADQILLLVTAKIEQAKKEEREALGNLWLNRAKVGMDALPENEQGFWKG